MTHYDHSAKRARICCDGRDCPRFEWIDLSLVPWHEVDSRLTGLGWRVSTTTNGTRQHFCPRHR